MRGDCLWGVKTGGGGRPGGAEGSLQRTAELPQPMLRPLLSF